MKLAAAAARFSAFPGSLPPQRSPELLPVPVLELVLVLVLVLVPVPVLVLVLVLQPVPELALNEKQAAADLRGVTGLETPLN